jgi:hypothetical protein
MKSGEYDGALDTELQTCVDPEPGQYMIEFPSKKSSRGMRLPSYNLHSRVSSVTSYCNLV